MQLGRVVGGPGRPRTTPLRSNGGAPGPDATRCTGRGLELGGALPPRTRRRGAVCGRLHDPHDPRYLPSPYPHPLSPPPCPFHPVGHGDHRGRACGSARRPSRAPRPRPPGIDLWNSPCPCRAATCGFGPRGSPSGSGGAGRRPTDLAAQAAIDPPLSRRWKLGSPFTASTFQKAARPPCGPSWRKGRLPPRAKSLERPQQIRM